MSKVLSLEDKHLLIRQNRIGTFKIKDSLLRSSSAKEETKKIFSNVFVIKSKHLPSQDYVEYLGYSKFFEEHKISTPPPEYIIKYVKYFNGEFKLDIKKKQKKNKRMKKDEN